MWKNGMATTTWYKDMNLEIHEGEFLTLLGPSGCGKTTTLPPLISITRPTSSSRRTWATR
ncbi:MAG: ATP-binding cassette domain-containing protein [Hominenteromicrobium sp.]|uniref:ATP-binding cassette domain-containing protein n=1 Tax=Hominenteromicrobium sp. TaxID=3073581 RepID=UPI003995D2F3